MGLGSSSPSLELGDRDRDQFECRECPRLGAYDTLQSESFFMVSLGCMGSGKRDATATRSRMDWTSMGFVKTDWSLRVSMCGFRVPS